ncbi:MAG: TolB family protein [Candidatus Bipolaricaulaceae bacterium]
MRWMLALLAAISWTAAAGFVDLTCLDWSPDGQYMLFAQAGALYVGQAPNGRDPVRVTPEAAQVTWGRFGPSSEWFVFATPAEGGYALWRGRIGEEPEELYFSPHPIFQPAVAPGGEVVAFLSERDGQRDIFLVDLASGEEEQLTRTPFQEACPDFSPTGDLLLFVGLWPDEADGSWDLFIIDLQTGGIEQLTADSFFDWGARFSPDGEWIAFETDRGGRSDIYVVRKDGTDLTPFTYDPWRDAFPAWSPEGDRIAFASRRSDGWVILAEGTY